MVLQNAFGRKGIGLDPIIRYVQQCTCLADHLTARPALGQPPGEKISEEYKTEYSTDKIEMHVGAIQPGQRVVLVGGGRRRCVKCCGSWWGRGLGIRWW